MRIRFVSVLVAMMIIFSGMVILTDDAESFTIRLAGPNSTYKTIQDAIDASGDKDVIIVENGTYYESVTINTKNIILIGNSTTDCKIIHHHDGTDSSTDYAAGINITASGVTVTGFNITTTGNYTYGISIRSATTLHVNIMNNNITTSGTYADGVYATGADENNITSNNIWTTGDYGHCVFIDVFSDGNNLNNNILNASGYRANGITLDSNNMNDLTNNTIYTHGGTARGIRLIWSDDNDVIGNTFYTYGSDGGVQAFRSNSNKFIRNIVEDQTGVVAGAASSLSTGNIFEGNIINCTSGSGNYGIYILRSDDAYVANNTVRTTVNNQYGIELSGSNDGIVFNNTVITQGDSASGIMIGQTSGFVPDNNTVYKNRINTSGQSAHGIRFNYGTNNRLYDNEIGTANIQCNGIRLQRAEDNHAVGNTIHVTGSASTGVYVFELAHRNTIDGNTLLATDSASYGVYVINTCDNNIITNNTVNTTQSDSMGIRVDQSSDHNTIRNNTVGTDGVTSHGIYLLSSPNYNTIENNNITTKANSADGIRLFSNTDHNTIANNTIDATNGYGIYMVTNVDYGTIINNTIYVSGIREGIYCGSTSDLDIIDNYINSSGSGRGINIDSSNDVNITLNTIDTFLQGADGIRISGGSNNVVVDRNILHIRGLQTHGITFTSVSGNLMINNSVIIDGNNGYGLYVSFNADDNTIINNTVLARNINARGLMMSQGDGNDIVDNRFNTTGSGGDGMYLDGSDGNNITNNKVNTTGPNAEGIYFNQDCEDNLVNDNTIYTSGSNAEGIDLRMSVQNNIINNTVKITGSNSKAIIMEQNSKQNNVSHNNITSTVNGGYGIYIWSSSHENVVYQNTIHTRAFDAWGIGIWNGCFYNELIDNTITTEGISGHGILIRQGSNVNNASWNDITVSGSLSHGIYLDRASDCNLNFNDITSSAPTAFGIYLFQNSENNTVYDTAVYQSGSNSYGIEITQFSVFNEIINCNITTNAANGYGISIDASNNTRIVGCDITTQGSTSPGIFLDGEYARAVDSTISAQNAASNDLAAVNDGNMTVINCNFNKIEASAGIVQVRNYLGVQVYNLDGVTPIPGADVEVQDNGAAVYASSGYGGSDPKTDVPGQVNNIEVTDRWYYYSNTATENTTDIKAKMSTPAPWENSQLNVNMASSHTEVILAPDIVGPSAPMNVSVERVGIVNTMKISWDISPEPDTQNYTIWKLVGSIWVVLANILHPQNWTQDFNQPDNAWYSYKVQPWDNVSNPGTNSSVVNFFLTDITPPETPQNAAAASITFTDSINITWTANTDDTINYSVWWQHPLTSVWEEIANVTQPQNWFVFSHVLLVDDGEYDFKVKAFDKVDLPSGFSNIASVTHVDTLRPEPPLDLKAVAVSSSEINLSWTPSPTDDVVTYRVWINETGGDEAGPWKALVEVSTFSFTAKNLASNTKYYFTVLCLDEASNPSLDSNVAINTTFAKAPATPTLDALPDYSNKALFNATGTSELGTTVYIFIDNVQAAFGPTTGSGTFSVPVSLSEGGNDIKARAENTALILSGFSAVETVILDTEPPKASAGPDMAVKVGTKVELNASASTDNYGIANYTWEFAYGGRAIIELYGVAYDFIFDAEDEHYIELTVTDLAGNTGTDAMYVNVSSEVIRPWVLFTTPENNAENVTIDSDVVITFDLVMNKTVTEGELSVSPSTGYTYNWSTDGKILTIEFAVDHDYNTTYTVTIGTDAASETGGLLNAAPFTLSFTTEPQPVVTISMDPITATDIQPGDTITVSGTSVNIDAGTNVSVSINGQTAWAETGADGKWSVSIKVPTTPGEYTVQATATGQSTTATVTVQEPPKEEKKEAEEESNMLYIGLLLFIIIIIVVLLIVMRRKKPETEPETEAEPESEDSEGGELTEDAMYSEEAKVDELALDEEPEEDPSTEPPAPSPETIDEEEFDEDEAEAEDDEFGDEDEAVEEDEEFDEEEADAVADMQTVDCPKCSSEISIEPSEEAKVHLQCPSCGAKGKIKNPYL